MSRRFAQAVLIFAVLSAPMTFGSSSSIATPPDWLFDKIHDLVMSGAEYAAYNKEIILTWINQSIAVADSNGKSTAEKQFQLRQLIGNAWNSPNLTWYNPLTAPIRIYLESLAHLVNGAEKDPRNFKDISVSLHGVKHFVEGL